MLFSIFVVSCVVCVLMIFVRLVEIKRQKVFRFTDIVNTYDALCEEKFDEFKQCSQKKKQDLSFFITHHVPFHLWNTAHDMTRGLRERYAKIERTIRGRNMIKQTGEASDFIKKISEDKNK